jgi:hypothetical protein
MTTTKALLCQRETCGKPIPQDRIEFKNMLGRGDPLYCSDPCMNYQRKLDYRKRIATGEHVPVSRSKYLKKSKKAQKKSK